MYQIPILKSGFLVNKYMAGDLQKLCFLLEDMMTTVIWQEKKCKGPTLRNLNSKSGLMYLCKICVWNLVPHLVLQLPQKWNLAPLCTHLLSPRSPEAIYSEPLHSGWSSSLLDLHWRLLPAFRLARLPAALTDQWPFGMISLIPDAYIRTMVCGRLVPLPR